MKLNVQPASIHTHEGGKAKHINAEQQLRRSVMACMLWEDSFYESGEDIASRITSTVAKVKPEIVRDIAIEARGKMKLRHAPLLIARAMASLQSHKKLVADTLANIVQRPDELAEFLSIYWKNGREKVSAQVKKGLAKAFSKFNAYQLAKYNRDGAIKLRDVLFICHAKPKDKEQEALFKQLIDGTLTTPDTWEVELSASKDKKASWERLLKEKKLGALALLRNLRNFKEAKIEKGLIREALSELKTERVLPFRFISAARHAPDYEPELEKAMVKSIEGCEQLSRHTVLMVDVSGSMDSQISNKSEVIRIDAACGLAILLRKICEDLTVVTFSDTVVQVPARRGFALRDAIKSSQVHSGTYLGQAIKTAQANIVHDRLIVITDEQAHDSVPDPDKKGYFINVAAYKNGVGYGKWTHIDGWSEAIIDYIIALESQPSREAQ